jgi:hypothetical protein
MGSMGIEYGVNDLIPIEFWKVVSFLEIRFYFYISLFK